MPFDNQYISLNRTPALGGCRGFQWVCSMEGAGVYPCTMTTDANASINSAGPVHADWLLPQWPVPAQVRALCTTRAGGMSGAPYDSLNLGPHVGDHPAHVQHNRAVLQQALGARPVFMVQVHGTHVLELGSETPDHLQADGCTTTALGVACTVMVADCLPILLCDMAGTRVAAAHAGWRGLLGKVGAPEEGGGSQGVVEQIVKHFLPAAPAKSAQAATKIIAWLGPCIGPQAFEVGPEVRAAFVGADPQAAQCFAALPADKWLADLAGLARLRLRAMGVHAIYGNDSSTAWCTVSNPSRFFSHRRDLVSGRQGACIWLE
jgi:polyphenol oxidase